MQKRELLKKRPIGICLLISFVALLSSCGTTSHYVLDKEKGWLQINLEGNDPALFYCDATLKWPTCRVPKYEKIED